MLIGNISPHLSWKEFLITQHRQFLELQENPPPHVIANAKRFAYEIFEPARALVGPLVISSGYRCPELNTAIGGSHTSAHMDGRAVDCYPLRASLKDAYIVIGESDVSFDQLIFEFGRWIHMGGAKLGVNPRRQLLMIFELGHYEFFNKDDSRVR